MALRALRAPVVAPAPVRARATPAPARPVHAVDRFAAGNSAATMVIQRESRADARTWLKRLLAQRGGSLGAALAPAAGKLAVWSTDRLTMLLAGMRGSVDGFEVAIGTAGLLAADANARKVIGLLEGAQNNAALGARLVDLFQNSLQPVLGLAIAAELPEVRLRAVLQTTADGAKAVTAVRTRNPVGGLPTALRGIYDYLGTLSDELADPNKAGVTATTATRETKVEAILTPPAVAAARAAAAAAGLPPPAFIPAKYYENLMTGLHQQVVGSFAYFDKWNKRKPMDTKPGGHVEGIATEAKARVDSLFGDYGSKPAPALTFAAGNLADRTKIVGDPFDMVRYFVNEGADTSVSNVQLAHHSFEDAAAAQVIEAKVIEHYSGRSAPVAANEKASLAAIGVATAERIRQLQIIDKMWPGVAQGGNVSLRTREGGSAKETRGIYWGLFKTMLHEYLHTTANGAYTTWYQGLKDSHHKTTFQEGFTDLFTLKAWNSVYPNEIAANRGFRQRIQGTADGDLDMVSVGHDPGHYPELAEAQKIEAEIGLANMRAGYFRGNTAVLGGTKLPR